MVSARKDVVNGPDARPATAPTGATSRVFSRQSRHWADGIPARAAFSTIAWARHDFKLTSCAPSCVNKDQARSSSQILTPDA